MVGAQLIDGKGIAAEIRQEVTEEVGQAAGTEHSSRIDSGAGRDDPASQTYVRSKQRACEEVGIRSGCKETPW